MARCLSLTHFGKCILNHAASCVTAWAVRCAHHKGLWCALNLFITTPQTVINYSHLKEYIHTCVFKS